MEFLYEMKKYLQLMIIIIEGVVITILVFLLLNGHKEKYEIKENDEVLVASEETEKELEPKKIKVDVKGAVKKPGVYEVEENSIVDDVIKLAGGLTKNGTTKNINLSKSLKNEMVIKVFTLSELNKNNTDKVVSTETCQENTIIINECETASVIETSDDKVNNNIVENKPDTVQDNEKEVTSNVSTNSKVNINTATKEELMQISGIGESKAISIIAYRQNNPFKTIDEIKNVSGIGEALFAKIKDSITV